MLPCWRFTSQLRRLCVSGRQFYREGTEIKNAAEDDAITPARQLIGNLMVRAARKRGVSNHGPKQAPCIWPSFETAGSRRPLRMRAMECADRRSGTNHRGSIV